MPRTFIAANIPCVAGLPGLLADMQRFGKSLKPVAAENLHFTLRFLGDTDAALLPRIADVLRSAAAGVGPFDLELVGLGAFPSPARPNVIWLGAPNAQPLERIASHLSPGLDELGFPADRPFSPHLTVARVKARPPAELRALLDRHRATRFGAARIDAVHLMLSDLQPTGPRYTVAASVPLAG